MHRTQRKCHFFEFKVQSLKFKVTLNTKPETLN
jgi:hypothetical protein